MSIVDNVKEFFWGIALKKGVQAGLKFLAGYLALHAGLLSSFGVTVDLSVLQAGALTSILAALEVFRNWAKQKTGLQIL